MGAKRIAFLVGKWNERTKDEAYGQLLKTTRSLYNYAGEKGMMAELEAFDYDMDKAALIGPAPYATKFAADMRSTHSNSELLVGLSHFSTTYEDSRFVIRTLRPYITHFHIGDAIVIKGSDAYGDVHPRFGYPKGADDVAQLVDFFTVLEQEGFFNIQNPYVLSMEITPHPDEGGDIILTNTKHTIDYTWILVED